jgi:hypothetical protein
VLLAAEDFSLTRDGIGPIRVHTALSYKGVGERLIATATNDSGSAIPPSVGLCVKVATGGCLFTLWNTTEWEPGVQRHWDFTARQHLPNLAHEVVIEAPNSGAAQFTNADLLAMLKQGVGPDVVLLKMKLSHCSFDTSVNALGALKAAGANDEILKAVLSGGVASTESVMPSGSAGVVDSGSPKTVRPWAKLFIAPMEGGLDGFIPPEIRKQSVPITVVLDEKDAEYILTGISGDAGSRWYDVIAAGPLWGKDKFEANVRLISVQYRSLVWAGEAGDRSVLFGGFRRGGQRKVAERIVKEMRRDLFGR